MEPLGRRQLIGGGALALAGLSAGAIAGAPEAAAAPSASSPGDLRSISFGWSIDDLHDNGADVSFGVRHDIVLVAADVDVSTVLLSPPPAAGFQEVLCQAAVSRQATPAYGPAPAAYLESPASADFGAVAYYNPSNLVIVGDGVLLQDKFVSIILKSWVPLDGTASSASRHVHTEPELAIERGDVLMFHMDHAGVGVKGQMQVVLTYRLDGIR